MDKSSEHNERNIICLEGINNEIVYVTQIAGLIARRIVCEVKENKSGFLFSLVWLFLGKLGFGLIFSTAFSIAKDRFLFIII